MLGLQSLTSVLPLVIHAVCWKRLCLELLIETLMVLAPANLGALAEFSEFLLEHGQARVSISTCSAMPVTHKISRFCAVSA